MKNEFQRIRSAFRFGYWLPLRMEVVMTLVVKPTFNERQSTFESVDGGFGETASDAP